MEFNVINFDFNNRKFIKYNIIPYLKNEYNKLSIRRRPKTIEEFNRFIVSTSLRTFSGRCEYEIILSDWPNNSTSEKIDVHYQIMNNIDVITRVLIKELNVRPRKVTLNAK